MRIGSNAPGFIVYEDGCALALPYADALVGRRAAGGFLDGAERLDPRDGFRGDGGASGAMDVDEVARPLGLSRTNVWRLSRWAKTARDRSSEPNS